MDTKRKQIELDHQREIYLKTSENFQEIKQMLDEGHPYIQPNFRPKTALR